MTVCFCFFKQKTAYEMRISDWSSDVCSSDLRGEAAVAHQMEQPREDAVGGVGVEVAGRLVGQEERGIVGQTSGDGGALLLAAGKASRAVGSALREAARGEQRRRPRHERKRVVQGKRGTLTADLGRRRS